MRDYKAYGCIAELFRMAQANTLPREILLDGPAGSGKSLGAGHFVHWALSTYPGSRVCVARKTLTSLRQTWQVTFEEKVLWHTHPIVMSGGSRHTRTHYDYPNGSELGLAGLDQPSRLFSSEWDIVLVVEAIELGLEEWELFHRALRNWKMPFQLLLGETNPGPSSHWLKKRCDEGVTHRMRSLHRDNPALTKAYLDGLDKGLSGARRERMYLGNWVAAEGLVWPEYDPTVHLLTCLKQEPSHGGGVLLHIQGWEQPVALTWFLAGLDFGYSAPGALQVWGFDEEGRMFRVAEVYKTQWDLDRWAEAIVKLYEEYPFQRLICDHEPRSIKFLNDYLEDHGTNRIATKWDKQRLSNTSEKAGIDAFRVRLKQERAFLIRDALREGRDQDLVDRGRPSTFEEEIEDYCYPKFEDGKIYRDEPDKTKADHACDAARCVAAWVRRKNLTPEIEPEVYPEGSWGAVLGHQKRWSGQK